MGEKGKFFQRFIGFQIPEPGQIQLSCRVFGCDAAREGNGIKHFHKRMPRCPVREFGIAGTAAEVRRNKRLKGIQLLQIFRGDDGRDTVVTVFYRDAA